MEEAIPNYCPTPAGYIIMKDGRKVPVGCRRWTCPHCGKWRKIRLAHRILRGFFDDKNVCAITLTQKRGSTQSIMANWKKLVRVLKREHSDLRYFWVKEFTKAGERHLHILINIEVKDLREEHSKLRRQWYQVTNHESYIVWINQDAIHNAPGYLMKYLTKAYSTEVRFKEKERRYGFSRDGKFSEKDYPIPGNFWENIARPEYMFINHSVIGKYDFKELARDGQAERFALDLINGTNNSKVMHLAI